ncbi:CoA transferase subunit A [Corynebacterium otitidis]|nr:CoA transferase subunit A [Corynebacterium otitidis]EJZ82572.1 3-oxoacid CoA-transferase, A subunit [Corynebacterium otitidis ATCC 51513]
MIDKTHWTAREAVADIADGVSIAVGGFGLVGVPEVLIDALIEQGASGLTIISNNLGREDAGLGRLLAADRISTSIGSYVSNNAEYLRRYLEGDIELQFVPQGTLAEKLRAGGAGIPAFYTSAGVGTDMTTTGLPKRYRPGEGGQPPTPVEFTAPKETRSFGGELYLLEEALTPDVGLVHAHKADRYGNLVFRLTARNFNPDVARAAKLTIVQAEYVVDELDPDEVHVPGIAVDRVVEVGRQDVKVERRTVTPRAAGNGSEA